MKICFFCKISDPKALELVEFYKQDIDALKELDSNLKIATSWKKIDFKSDVIFVWWWTYAIYPVLIGRLLGKKVIITGTFNYKCPKATLDYFRRPLYHRLMIKVATKMAHKNIMVSKNEYDGLTHDWKLDNTIYSPHGIDTSKYTPSNLPKEKVIFCMIWTGMSNMIRKSLPEIIDAAKEIKDILPDYKIKIGGRKGDGFESVKNMIKEKGLENYVELLGEISEDQKIRYFQTCQLYLQPSTYEGFGLALAEAMSCGATVISTKVGEVENVVGDSGVLLEGNSAIEISKAVIKVLSDSKSCEILGKKASNRIREFFPIEKRINSLQSIIQSQLK